MGSDHPWVDQFHRKLVVDVNTLDMGYRCEVHISRVADNKGLNTEIYGEDKAHKTVAIVSLRMMRIVPLPVCHPSLASLGLSHYTH